MFRFLGWYAGRALRHGMPCVGLIVFMGCFTFLVAPDDDLAPGNLVPHLAPRTSLALHSNPLSHKVLPPAGTPLVVIDPGHGGVDDGTKYFGLAEKDVTLDVGQRLERILKQDQIATVLTRRDDVYVPLPERVQIANDISENNSNVIFVSIHFNQSPVESVDGIETYYADEKIPPASDWTWIGFFTHSEDQQLDRGENLAAFIQNSLVSRMMATNRGIKSRSLFVVRHTRMPAVLVEGGFLSNKVQNQMLRNDGYRDSIAQGIASGIVAYVRTMHPLPTQHLASSGATQHN